MKCLATILLLISFCMSPTANAASQIDIVQKLYSLGEFRKALPILKDEATKGNAKAYVLLGNYYRLGLDGLPKDYSAARDLYLKAAAKNNREALLYLGFIERRGGYGINKNINKSLEWLKLAILPFKVENFRSYESTTSAMRTIKYPRNSKILAQSLYELSLIYRGNEYFVDRDLFFNLIYTAGNFGYLYARVDYIFSCPAMALMTIHVGSPRVCNNSKIIKAQLEMKFHHKTANEVKDADDQCALSALFVKPEENNFWLKAALKNKNIGDYREECLLQYRVNGDKL